jgi:disulfide bond formation protein DsbB
MTTSIAGAASPARTGPEASTKPAIAATLALVFGAATITAAWGFQLLGGYVPCALCLEQRIPYYVALPVLAAGLLARRFGAPTVVLRAALVVAAAAFAYGLALAIYHAGVEWGYFPAPADCGGGVATTGNAGDLMAQLKATRVASCSDATWRMFGLSFAGWNVVVSMALVVLTLAGALAGRKVATR